MFKKARARRAERLLHNDRDSNCRLWWGDRGGYDLRAQRCSVCDPDNEPPRSGSIHHRHRTAAQ